MVKRCLRLSLEEAQQIYYNGCDGLMKLLLLSSFTEEELKGENKKERVEDGYSKLDDYELATIHRYIKSAKEEGRDFILYKNYLKDVFIERLRKEENFTVDARKSSIYKDKDISYVRKIFF